MPKASSEEGIDKSFKGAATMRHQCFLRRIYFTKALSLAIGHKHGVIAKTAEPTWRPGEVTINTAFIEVNFTDRPSHAKRAIEIGTALFRRGGAKRLQLFFNQAHGHHPIPVRPRPVRRVNSRVAIERIYAKAGIIGQRHKTR